MGTLHRPSDCDIAQMLWVCICIQERWIECIVEPYSVLTTLLEESRLHSCHMYTKLIYVKAVLHVLTVTAEISRCMTTDDSPVTWPGPG